MREFKDLKIAVAGTWDMWPFHCDAAVSAS